MAADHTPARRSRSGTKTRQRPKLVGVRLSEGEYAALTDASARTGKTRPALLRETFLAADAHQLMYDLHGRDSYEGGSDAG